LTHVALSSRIISNKKEWISLSLPNKVFIFAS